MCPTTGLLTCVPLTFVFLVRLAVVNPLQVAGTLGKAVGADPEPVRGSGNEARHHPNTAGFSYRSLPIATLPDCSR